MVLKGEVGFYKVVSVVESALSKTKTERDDATENKRTISKKLQNHTFQTEWNAVCYL